MNADDTERLSEVIREVLGYVRSSSHEGWAQLRPTEEIARSLEQLSKRWSGDADARQALRVAFAPTGELQELSMANGWAEEFVVLSGLFDDLIGRS